MTLILTMSGFGRTVRENGNRGTDHGHANAMFVLGNSVRGGKAYGQWPGLKSDQLYEGRDLNLTTDFRDVFAELARRHLGTANLKSVFPGYAISDARFRGVLGQRGATLLTAQQLKYRGNRKTCRSSVTTAGLLVSARR